MNARWNVGEQKEETEKKHCRKQAVQEKTIAFSIEANADCYCGLVEAGGSFRFVEV